MMDDAEQPCQNMIDMGTHSPLISDALGSICYKAGKIKGPVLVKGF